MVTNYYKVRSLRGADDEYHFFVDGSAISEGRALATARSLEPFLERKNQGAIAVYRQTEMSRRYGILPVGQTSRPLEKEERRLHS